MTWVIWIWTIVFAIWIIGGVSSNNSNDRAYCQTHINHYFSMQDCLNASHAGTAIGAVLIFFLWFIGFIVLSLIWFMTRRKGRDCPVCGSDVKRGRTVCKECGYDFATQSRPTPPATASP
jgi:lysylphosphatidylglycerol synthetase-like protein (DUF2156 family)